MCNQLASSPSVSSQYRIAIAGVSQTQAKSALRQIAWVVFASGILALKEVEATRRPTISALSRTGSVFSVSCFNCLVRRPPTGSREKYGQKPTAFCKMRRG